MSRALQCPSCGHVHPMTLPEIAGNEATFRCHGCSRLLSAPPMARAAEEAPTAAEAREPSVTVAVPTLGATGDPADGPPEVEVAAARPLPGAVRVLVWIVALGVGLAVATLTLRSLGVIDIDQAIDVFAGIGLGRFAVLLVLLPLWALLSGTLAHFTLEALSRRRRPPTASGSGSEPTGS